MISKFTLTHVKYLFNTLLYTKPMFCYETYDEEKMGKIIACMDLTDKGERDLK